MIIQKSVESDGVLKAELKDILQKSVESDKALKAEL